MHADLVDEQAQEFLGLFRVSSGDDLLELVGEADEGGRVRRRVGLCGEPAGELGVVATERFEAVTQAVDPLLAEADSFVTSDGDLARAVSGLVETATVDGLRTPERPARNTSRLDNRWLPFGVGLVNGVAALWLRSLS